MLKNSLVYHRLWYIKRRQSKKLFTYAIIFSVIIIFAFLVSYAERRALPYLGEICEYKANSAITVIISQCVGKEFKESIKYDDLVLINRDENGRIASIQTDVVKMNALSSRLTAAIQSELSSQGRFYIDVPSGALLGSPLFAAVGPDMHFAIIPAGNTEADFKSEFSSSGINQTRHRISLQIKTKVGIMVPLLNKNCEVVNNIPVAETIIVGEIPSSYFNIDGINQGDKQ